jgi:hypothetical protein
MPSSASLCQSERTAMQSMRGDLGLPTLSDTIVTRRRREECDSKLLSKLGRLKHSCFSESPILGFKEEGAWLLVARVTRLFYGENLTVENQ